jgi:phosphatidylinositol glycan class A protein
MVVSTDVGGVPEVLPPHMMYLAKPIVDSLAEKLS